MLPSGPLALAGFPTMPRVKHTMPLICRPVLRIAEACHDFSGLAVDPKSGHVFLCSDESATVAEIVITRGRAPRGELVAVTELRSPKGAWLECVEGLAFDDRGDLFVLLENDRELWRFARKG